MACLKNRRSNKFIMQPIRHANGRIIYFDVRVQEWELDPPDMEFYIITDVLHEHGLVDKKWHVGDQLALPMLNGSHIVPGEAQDGAIEAVVNFVPTGKHFEDEDEDDSVNDAYV